MTVTVDVSGLPELRNFFEAFPVQASQAMSIAINTVVDGVASQLARKEITEQVAFPVGYLDEPGRFGVSKYATPTSLEAKLTARPRPTSLARFASGPRGAISLEVKPGRRELTPRLFRIGLNRGTEAGGNSGIAIRLRPGERLVNKREMHAVQLKKRDGSGELDNVFVLYGPSVEQVFVDVASEIAAPVSDALLREFNRLIAVKLGVP